MRGLQPPDRRRGRRRERVTRQAVRVAERVEIRVQRRDVRSRRHPRRERARRHRRPVEQQHRLTIDREQALPAPHDPPRRRHPRERRILPVHRRLRVRGRQRRPRRRQRPLRRAHLRSDPSTTFAASALTDCCTARHRLRIRSRNHPTPPPARPRPLTAPAPRCRPHNPRPPAADPPPASHAPATTPRSRSEASTAHPTASPDRSSPPAAPPPPPPARSRRQTDRQVPGITQRRADLRLLRNRLPHHRLRRRRIPVIAHPADGPPPPENGSTTTSTTAAADHQQHDRRQHATTPPPRVRRSGTCERGDRLGHRGRRGAAHDAPQRSPTACRRTRRSRLGPASVTSRDRGWEAAPEAQNPGRPPARPGGSALRPRRACAGARSRRGSSERCRDSRHVRHSAQGRSRCCAGPEDGAVSSIRGFSAPWSGRSDRGRIAGTRLPFTWRAGVRAVAGPASRRWSLPLGTGAIRRRSRSRRTWSRSPGSRARRAPGRGT